VIREARRLNYVALFVALLAAGTSTAAASHRHSGHHYPRSAEVKRAFERETGHPRGWKGHVVDHVDPLACGGADATFNMQWQTVADARAKDKVERIGCSNGHR
jgi:hypothetical protein